MESESSELHPLVFGYMPHLEPVRGPTPGYRMPTTADYLAIRKRAAVRRIAERAKKWDADPETASIVGKTYGLLYVEELVHQYNSGNRYRWRCTGCGAKREGPGAYLTSGYLKTCGSASCRKKLRAQRWAKP